MKPAFALDFRNDAIALLHRTSGGWHQVGRVTFDEPDLASALSYLRSTALGLDPRGLATTLILPEEQMLLTTVDAPGPDDATRLDQIRTALEGRTPYAVEDLVFDWEEVGGEVRVAVIARETLAEAEGFAVEHRFNPVSFAAAPAAGFAKAPWFGPTVLAASLLVDGDFVEREIDPVRLVSRDTVFETAASDVEPGAMQVDAALDEEPAPNSAAADDLHETLAEAPVDEAETAYLETSAPQDESADSPYDLPLQAAADDDNGHWSEPAPAEETLADDTGAYVQSDDLPEDRPEYSPEDWPEPVAQRPQDLLAEPEDILQSEAGRLAQGEQRAADFTPDDFTPDDPAPAQDLRERSLFGVADDELPPSFAFGAAGRGGAQDRVTPVDELPADLAAALQDIVLEEAPMAEDVQDDDGLQPQGLQPQGLGADLPRRDMAAPGGLSATPPAAPVGITDMGLPDDVPPVPGYTPAMGFASRRASADTGQSAKVAPPVSRPSVPRPVAAKPITPPAPKVERAALSRPTAAKPVVAKMSKGLRGLGALVSAPSLPGSRAKRVDAPSSPAPAASASASPPPIAKVAAAAAQTLTPSAAPPAGQGASTLGSHIGRRNPPMRGKPRYLGLALTLLLLLVLAVIAAWSTTLAFRNAEPYETQLAADSLPAPEDEMAADGLDPEEFAADAADTALPTTLPEETADAAPAIAATQADTPAEAPERPGAASGDEIFLAAKNQPPAPPAPVAAPTTGAESDPLPVAQAPPPPFGTVYQFDANGLIIPTPEGIVTPDGVMLIAGKPPVVPKARQAAIVAAASAPVVDAPGVDAAAVDAAATEAAAPTEALPFADPALAGFRPKSRPAGLTPPTIEGAPAASPDDASAPSADPDATNRLASLRPKARPEAVLAAGDAARAAEAAAAASLAAAPEPTPEAAAAAPASTLAVAFSRRPEPRPRDLSRSVEAAVAAAVRTPTPAPEPEPEQTASLQPKAKPEPKPEPEAKEEKSATSAPKGGGRDGDLDDHPEADDEPELPAVKAGKSSGSVAKQATFKNALNLSKTALIGVYGTPSKRYAMIRTANGRYKKVRVGDQVDGGRIQAITASEVRYQKGSKLVTLEMPRS